jgi:hypothetical protein
MIYLEAILSGIWATFFMDSLAKKSDKRGRILTTNLINHLNFGIGLYIWMLIFHRLSVHF